MLARYGERVPPFDLQIGQTLGPAERPLGNDSADSMISATTFEHDLTVVTRNV